MELYYEVTFADGDRGGYYDGDEALVKGRPVTKVDVVDLNTGVIVRSYRPGGAGRPIRLDKGQRFQRETDAIPCHRTVHYGDCIGRDCKVVAR